MARRHSRGLTRGVRRETAWLFVGVFSETDANANTATLLGSLDATALALRPFTIVRTHLEVQVLTDQAVAAEQQSLAVGMAVVSDQASAIGVTAVPTPHNDAGSDYWYLHQYIFADSSITANESIQGQNRSIDSKAMRKVDDDSDVILVGEGAGIGNGMIYTIGGRFLIKLH